MSEPKSVYLQSWDLSIMLLCPGSSMGPQKKKWGPYLQHNEEMLQGEYNGRHSNFLKMDELLEKE